METAGQGDARFPEKLAPRVGPFVGSPEHTQGKGRPEGLPARGRLRVICTLQGTEAAHRPPARPSMRTRSGQVPPDEGPSMWSRAPAAHVCARAA